MSSTLYQLTKPHSLRVEIKKSHFLAQAARADSEPAARAFIAQVSEQAANHHCWAYRVQAIYRFNDDGEPGGSAGQPILQAIDGESMDNTVIVVTRWFGGIKLGIGGLIRAYGGSAQNCLKQASREAIIATVTRKATVAYPELELIKTRLVELDARLSNETYAASEAGFCFTLPAIHLEHALALIRDISRGKAHIDTP